MTLVVAIIVSIGTAAIAAFLTHRLTSQRDQMNRRSDMRTQYLLAAYRALADTSYRDLGGGSAYIQAFEQGLADIQLLGSKRQAEMAIDIARALAEDGKAKLDDLLLSLRDDLRSELRLEPLAQAPFHLRIDSND